MTIRVVIFVALNTNPREQVVQFIYAGMVMDDCAIPDGPSNLGDYIAVLS